VKHRYTVRIVGEGAAETAHALVRRLAELGCHVCPPDRKPSEDFAGVAVLLGQSSSSSGADETVEVSPHDTPDFAAEKILDLLDERGVISMESEDYSPEEEEAVRKRLADLGYIE